MVANFVLPIAMKIGEYLVAPVGRQFGYLFFCESNIKNLEKQVQKLEDKRFGVQKSVDEAETKRETIAPDVQRWLTTVNELSEEAKKFLEDEVKANKGCLNGWCPNLKARYSLSRKATKKTQGVEELRGEGNFSRVSYPTVAPPMGTTFTFTRGFKGFESRRSIMNDVMEALTNDSIYMIGICGMGGVGKTTMVKEVAKKAEEKNMFDKIVMVVVSQNPDLINIQGEIAEILDFKLSGGTNLFARAGDLGSKILSIERVLVILDDVWKRLELNDIGIPCGDHHKGCKIVLTSRSADVCNEMCVGHIFPVEVLSKEEAWNLFKEKAGIFSDTTDMHSTQMAVANECGGLPIAIVTVGRALNGRGKPSWDYALQQLQKSTGKNINRVEEEVFIPLELSYKFLENEEAKKCFLLCSLFPEDFNIPVEYLVRYGIGLKLFKDIDTVSEARNKVHYLVDYLQKCYLLMDSLKEEAVKMHDVIRDVAISIVSTDENSFMVRYDDALKDWAEKDQHKNYFGISLIHGLSDNLEFRKLHLLQLAYMDKHEYLETPGNLFDGMEELKVVTLSKMSIRSLPTSLPCLTNLRTLSLINCQLIGNDISLIGALKNLEILSFVGSRMKELPKEIGQLSQLKVLDLENCRGLERIYPGVLSSLSKLEELYVGSSFSGWEIVEGGKGGTNASLAELTSLSNLAAFDIHIIQSELSALWPRDLVLEKLIKFSITVGNDGFFLVFRYLLPNELRLYRLNMSDVMESGLMMFLKITKTLRISNVKGLKNILYNLDEDGFQHLTRLSLASCSDLEYLIYYNTIDGVPESAFPVLETLDLRNLHIFKGIIDHDRQLAKEAFSALKVLHLERLPELTHLWKDPNELVSSASEISNYDTIIQPLFHNKVKLATIEILSVYGMDNLIEIWPVELQAKLRNMRIYRCHKLSNIIFPSNLIKGLQSLELLEVDECRSVKVAFDLEGLIAREGHPDILLPSLANVNLSHLPKLTHVWKDNLSGIQGFHNLTSLIIKGCSSLRCIFSSSSLAKLLVKLQEIKVTECHVMEAIIGEEPKVDDEVATKTVMFPQLNSLILSDLPNFGSLCSQAYTFGGSLLKTVKVINCPNMKAFSSTFQRMQEQQMSHVQKANFFTSTQHHPLDGKLSLSNEGEVTVTGIEVEEPTEIWQNQLEIGCDQVRVLRVQCCGKLLSLVSSNLIPRLHNIKELKVLWCDSLEMIFDLQGGLCAGAGVAEEEISITQLSNLELKYLPKLMHIWKNFSQQTHCFRNLRSLKVEKCDSLRYIFTISTANVLVNLEDLTVKHCEKVEKIFTRDNEEEEEILLREYGSVELRYLPSLECFGPDINDTRSPFRSGFTLANCPKFEDWFIGKRN